MAAKNAIVKAGFELKSSHVCEKRSNCMSDILQFPTTNSVTSVNLKKAGVASRNIVKTKQYTLL